MDQPRRYQWIFLFLFAWVVPSFLPAQDSLNKKKPEPKRGIMDKIYFGGNLGLQFGNETFIDVSPLVGYKITERLSAGVGGTYIYYKNNYYDFSTSIYGGRVFLRYFFLENLFGHAEYELLNLETFDFRNRIYIENILIGGGYNQPLGGNAMLSLMILYNLNESVYSPYTNPIIRMGVTFGI